MPPPSRQSLPPAPSPQREPGRWRFVASFWETAGGWILPRDARGGHYWQVASENPAPIGFCLLFVFASGLGQTFLLSVFQPHWAQALQLNSGQMGTLYGGATLASGLLLPWAGRWLDLVPARRAGWVTLAGLATFGALMASVTHIWMLAVAVFGLRFFGQGLSANVGTTNAVRWFAHNRGKALSLAALGFPLGEALLPGLVTFGIFAWGWRWTWGALAGVTLVGLLPLSLALIARHPGANVDLEANGSGQDRSAIMRGKLKQDWRFYAMLGMIAPLPFVATGVIFFQGMIAESRGWSPAIFATGFLVYATVRASCSLSAGAWVDRLGAVKLLAVPSFAFATGLAFLLRPEPAWAYAFFVGMGISLGSSGAIMTAAWSELFGTANIGTIRGLSSSVTVFVSAAAPVVFGTTLNAGVPTDALILGSALLVIGVAWPLSVAVRRAQRQRVEPKY